MFEWMVEEQGMSEIEEPDRTEILDYLAAHYNTDRQTFLAPSGIKVLRSGMGRFVPAHHLARPLH